MSYLEFNCDLKIEKQYLDFIGHVNNAKYLELFEKARWSLLSESGLNPSNTIEKGEVPIILNCEIQFRRELVLNDHIKIQTKVSEILNSKQFLLEQNIYKENDTLASKAIFKVAIFDMKLRKMLPLSDYWRNVMGIK